MGSIESGGHVLQHVAQNHLNLLVARQLKHFHTTNGMRKLGNFGSTDSFPSNDIARVRPIY